MQDAIAERIEEAEDPRIRRAVERIRALLVPGESIEAYAVQRRMYALTTRRVVVAATSGRFVALRRDLLGGYEMDDVRWQDLRDSRLRAGIFGADLTLATLGAGDLATAERPSRTLSFTGLRKEQAEAIYRMCQAQEQAWREKRRIREMEELRAKSGGVHLGVATAAGGGLSADAPSFPGAGEDPVVRLQRARDMLQQRLITDAEYEAIKARIVSGL